MIIAIVFVIVMIPLGIPYFLSLLTSFGISAEPTSTDGYVLKMIFLSLAAGLNSSLFGAIFGGIVRKIRNRKTKDRSEQSGDGKPDPRQQLIDFRNSNL